MAASRTKESGEMAGAREEEPLVADASCVDAKGKERERRVNRDRDRERDRDGGTSDNVKVSVRCRPMVEKEQREGHRGVVRVDRLRREVTVQLPSPAQQRVFTYDVVFGPESTQAEVFNETARPIVDSVLQGYNGTIFAYGQTGTGKTHTMVGNKESAGMRGIIPNSFAHIFGHIAQSEGEVRFLVRVSYLEIYNEEVRDLLGKNHQARLEVRERPDIGVYVKDLSSFVVKGPEDMEKLMSIGNRNRAFGATDMNEYSSRSHTIFTITVECGEIGPDHKQHIRMGKLHLVDLAPNILEDTERAYLTYHLSQQLPPSSVPMGTTGATRGAHREKPSTGAGRRRNV